MAGYSFHFLEAQSQKVDIFCHLFGNQHTKKWNFLPLFGWHFQTDFWARFRLLKCAIFSLVLLWPGGMCSIWSFWPPTQSPSPTTPAGRRTPPAFATTTGEKRTLGECMLLIRCFFQLCRFGFGVMNALDMATAAGSWVNVGPEIQHSVPGQTAPDSPADLRPDEPYWAEFHVGEDSKISALEHVQVNWKIICRQFNHDLWILTGHASFIVFVSFPPSALG